MATNFIVIYNGGTETYKACSDPKVLTKGDRYTVTNIRQEPFQTYFTLDGIDGEFNSAWFKPVKTYVAIGKNEPKVGTELLDFYRLVEKSWQQIEHSSVVVKVTPVSYNVYIVETKFSVYVYQLIS